MEDSISMEQPAKISLLLSDVDGTLVTHDKVLTPGAIAAVRQLDDAGIAFTITSSRPPRALARFVDPLNLRLPIGGFNGGALVRPDLSIIETLALSPGAAGRAIEIILGHGLDAWVYSAMEWYVRDADAPHVAREIFTIGYPPIVDTDLGRHLDQVGKIVAVGDDAAAVARCNAELDAALAGQASATRSQSHLMDITHPDANKGMMVTTLSRMLEIPAAEIATIGDMENDVLMFRKSGLGIAMGNATPNVQREARLVTDTNEADGFAKAVERFILRKSGD